MLVRGLAADDGPYGGVLADADVTVNGTAVLIFGFFMLLVAGEGEDQPALPYACAVDTGEVAAGAMVFGVSGVVGPGAIRVC